MSLSPVWRAEELHTSELLLSALATPSLSPCSPSLRSLYPDINPLQPFRHKGCPHLTYCNHILVFQSHTQQVVLLLAYQTVCICVQELQKCLLTLVSSFTKALVLSSLCPMCLLPIDFHFYLYLQTVIIILSVPGLTFSPTDRQDWGKNAFRALLSIESHHLLAVLIPQKETCDYKSHYTGQLLTHSVYPLLPESCSLSSRTERNTISRLLQPLLISSRVSLRSGAHGTNEEEPQSWEALGSLTGTFHPAPVQDACKQQTS